MEKDTLIIVLDCETTNTLDDPICYDVGFAVVNPWTGKTIEKHSYVVADVFCDKDLMQYAYFADKIPSYQNDIKSGKRQLKRFSTIKRILANTCKKYDIKIIAAHNARFDYKALSLSQRYITTSKYRYFIPYGVEMWDTLKMAREIFKKDEKFGEFCYNHDYITKNGQRKYTAEILYQYLINDDTFEESHTGLEDVIIEAEIFTYCLNRKPDINGKLW